MDAVAQALADSSRREILRMLRDRSMNAGEIARAFSLSRPAISRHLRVLREARLVRDELSGREREYTLTLDALAELEAYLAELRAPGRWERRLMALETEVQRVKRGRARAPQTRGRTTVDEKETA
jgi:DNA-binding transcriptional ArsR family regulator